MSKKKKNGRPFKITPLIVSKLEEAASVDASVCEMCFHASISRPTYYAAIKRDKKLFNRLEDLRQKPALQARLTLCKAMAKDNVEASKWYLERKRKPEFAQRQEVAGPDGKPLTVGTTHIYIPHNDRNAVPPSKVVQPPADPKPNDKAP
jgi:hypothetical protein